MTKCYLDSNVLIYIKDTNSLKYSQSKEMLRSLISAGADLYISPLCLDEFIYEIGKFIFKTSGQKDYFWNLKLALSSILELPNLSIINPPITPASLLEILDLMETFSLRPRDAYHLLTMQVNNVDTFATFDDDFKKVFAAKILLKA